MKSSNIKTLLLSLIVMALWGSLFPMVKIGYKVFGIASTSVPDILMFAGVRFTLCGLAVCIYSYFKKEKLEEPKSKSIGMILFMGLFSIVLHYAFVYTGLGLTDSSKSALIKQLGTLLYTCFAFLFIKSEKFSILKIVGAIVGFGGIIAININSAGISFALGDILLICASVCTVISSIIGKRAIDGSSSFWITGISQLGGGIILLIAAFVMGADMLNFDIKSTMVFIYICLASTGAYVLWYYILGSNSLSKMFIIKFAEPLFACIFGAILLGENIFKVQYLAAFVLISLGIMLGNRN